MRYLLLLIIGLLLLPSCTNDDNQAGPSLTGRWEIESAQRNGRPTESLDELYFEFTELGEFGTNIGGTPAQGQFTREDNNILSKGLQPELVYEIKNITDSTLDLKSRYGNYRFDFRLRRVADQSTDPSS